MHVFHVLGEILMRLQYFLANTTAKFELLEFVLFMTFHRSDVYACERALVALKAFVSVTMYIYILCDFSVCLLICTTVDICDTRTIVYQRQ